MGHQRLQLLHELELRLVEANVDLSMNDGGALILSSLGHLGVAVACERAERISYSCTGAQDKSSNVPRLVTPIPEVKSNIWRPVSVVM